MCITLTRGDNNHAGFAIAACSETYIQMQKLLIPLPFSLEAAARSCNISHHVIAKIYTAPDVQVQSKLLLASICFLGRKRDRRLYKMQCEHKNFTARISLFFCAKRKLQCNKSPLSSLKVHLRTILAAGECDKFIAYRVLCFGIKLYSRILAN